MFTIVRHNTVKFMERFGKLKKTLQPGLHFYIPFVNRVTQPLELKELYQDFDHRRVITKDNVEIDVDGIFFFKVTDPEKAFYSVEDFQRAIDDLSMSVSRSEIGKTKLDDMFQHRKLLNEKIKDAMNNSTTTWGIQCLNYEILKIELPKKILEALRFVAEAERLRRRDVIVSEAEREYQISISEAQKTASVIIEEGKAEAVKIKAEELAKGLSEFSGKLGDGEHAKTLTNYLLTENYISKYGKILKKSNVMVFPESTDGKMDSGLVSLAYIMKNVPGSSMHAAEPKDNQDTALEINRPSSSFMDLDAINRHFKDTSSQINEQKPDTKPAIPDRSAQQSTADKDLAAFLNKLEASK